MDSDELSESGGVVVPRSLGIAVGLQDGVGGHDLVFKGDLLLDLLTTAAGGHHGQVGDHLLGVLRLSSSGLTGDQHGVVLLVLQHVAVGSFSDSPQVGRNLEGSVKMHHILVDFQPFLIVFGICFQVQIYLVPSLAKVDLADPMGVQWVTLVRVHHLDDKTFFKSDTKRENDLDIVKRYIHSERRERTTTKRPE